MNIFTIYSISSNGDVFYIGRTSNLKRRKTEHLCDKSKTHKTNKINKLKRLGLPIEFNILHENLSFYESIILEIKEIKEHKERGIVLTNLTDGGEGLYGVKRPPFSEEWKDKLKESRKTLFNDGYVVYNKGTKLEDLIGPEKAAEQKELTGKKISQGIKNGTIRTNKGKKLEEIVSVEKAKELRQLSSDTARKTFIGRKQSSEHLDSRVSNQKTTKANWTEEQRNEVRLINKLNGAKSIKKYNFLVNNEFKHYGTWKSLSLALKEELGIIVGEGSLSQFYRGKVNKLKCDVTDIKIC